MKRKKAKVWSPNGYLFAAFRKVWRWSPVRGFVLEGAKVGNKYACVTCQGRFKREEVAIDHKEPVVNPSTGFEGWDMYYSRLFCPPEGLQVLCLTCHKLKSKTENAERRRRKK